MSVTISEHSCNMKSKQTECRAEVESTMSRSDKSAAGRLLDTSACQGLDDADNRMVGWPPLKPEWLEPKWIRIRKVEAKRLVASARQSRLSLMKAIPNSEHDCAASEARRRPRFGGDLAEALRLTRQF